MAGIIYRDRYGSTAEFASSMVANAGVSTAEQQPARPTVAGVYDMARERAEKLIFFESIFFKIDDNCNLSISEEECDLFLSCARHLPHAMPHSPGTPRPAPHSAAPRAAAAGTRPPTSTPPRARPCSTSSTSSPTAASRASSS